MENYLKQIRRELGLRQQDLALILDCRKENISMIECGKSSLSERNKRLLVKKFNLNPAWFAGENVPMLAEAARHAETVQNDPLAVPGSVPLFDIELIPDLPSLFRHTAQNRARIAKDYATKKSRGRKSREDKQFEPTGWISFPGIPACDGALRIAGEAMNPAIRTNEMVLYRQLDTPAEVIWGERYLMSVETSAGPYTTVRYLRRSPKEGFAVIAGDNPAFADTEIRISDILAIALVKASVRVDVSK